MTHLEELKIKCNTYFKQLAAHNDRTRTDELLNQYDVAHPGLSSCELKAAQYEILAENIELVVFEESPFYFVNDITWCPGLFEETKASWLYDRNFHLYEDADPDTWRKFTKQQELMMFLCCGPYDDNVHFTMPIENVIKYGMKKFYVDAENAKSGASAQELLFLNAAQRGLLAGKRICQRYAEIAQEKLRTLTDPVLRKNMQMLIDAASHAPWEAPRTFFEGLNTCWFCRNVLGAMEGIGNQTLGRVDYLLQPLYENDIANGILTEAEAYELVKQFMLFGDMQYDKDTLVQDEHDHELEMGICLGGCDSSGKPVYNTLTHMFIQAQRELKCIYPKIHARYGSNSPEEYLVDLAESFVNGHSTIGLSCDDGIIPPLVLSGKTLEDARSYETCGCWENKVPAKESMAGGNYVYLITLLEQAVYGPEPQYVQAGAQIQSLENATNFEEVYQILLANAVNTIRWRCTSIGKYGKVAYDVNPLCLASALMDGCITSRKDYTQGGAVYNLNSCDIGGFANYVDAMLVINQLCFEEKVVTLKQLLEIVRHNWNGNEELLSRARHCPHFCDETPESKSLSQRLHNDLSHSLDGIVNEHGGKFIMNYYVYREFFRMGKLLRATPDGRRDGEMFAQGIGPSKYHPADSLASILQSVCALDRDKVATASLDIQLPKGGLTSHQLAQLLRATACIGVKHLQLNCVSLEELLDAQKHPENHQDLVVRVTGFSAKFVSLSPEFQEEFIQRHIHEEGSGFGNHF